MSKTRLRGDDGTITVLFAVVFVAFLMMLGLVVDGGRLLDQRSHAHDVAAKAARAGAPVENWPAQASAVWRWRFRPPSAT